MIKDIISRVDIDESIIQVKLLNVEKNSYFIGQIFELISNEGVNIDMISSVMLEEEMRIDFTCEQKDQALLNKAIEAVKLKHPRIMVYQNKNVAKLVVEGNQMKDEVGVASEVFNILGKASIPFSQVTTSEVSISFVIDQKDASKVKEILREVL